MFDASPVQWASFFIVFRFSRLKASGVVAKTAKTPTTDCADRTGTTMMDRTPEPLANLSVNPPVGFGVTAPLRHFPSDSHRGKARFNVDRLPDMRQRKAGCGTADHRAFVDHADGCARGSGFLQSSPYQVLENPVQLIGGWKRRRDGRELWSFALWQRPRHDLLNLPFHELGHANHPNPMSFRDLNIISNLDRHSLGKSCVSK